MNHTPEPWAAMPKPPASYDDHGWRSLAQCGNFIVAAPANVVLQYENNILVGMKWDHEANARRIVACVNACKGLSNEDLESGALFSAAGIELFGESNEIKILSKQLAAVAAQRDELLAAMKIVTTGTIGGMLDHLHEFKALVAKCGVQNG